MYLSQPRGGAIIELLHGPAARAKAEVPAEAAARADESMAALLREEEEERAAAASKGARKEKKKAQDDEIEGDELKPREEEGLPAAFTEKKQLLEETIEKIDAITKASMMIRPAVLCTLITLS